MKNVLFIASESVPFVKTGGLADVIGSLPKCIDKTKYDVRVMLPKYVFIKEEYKSKMEYITHFDMTLAWRNQYVGLFKMQYDGITFYFIDNEYYFAGFGPYGNIYEDVEKFAFFSRAALSALPILGFRPDIIHCHDWQTGLVPVFLNDIFQGTDFFKGIKTVMTIHNLKFQGAWDKQTVMDITGLSEYYFTPDKMEAYGRANYLKAGIVYSDLVTTVSKTYAEEICYPFYGEGLDGLMRARKNSLRGIVNGIDYDEYDPETDKYLVRNYNRENFRTEKLENKRALQKKLGLEQNDDKFMVGIVSRLTDQKGLDLVECVMEEICEDDTQFVVLGTGERRYEDFFRVYEHRFKGRVSANICYSNDLSHLVYAGCDAYLMPSLFEPCGLSQLMALRYGTVPIVRETGGLRDTVVPYNEYENTGTGFSFSNYNAHEMLATIRYAKSVFRDHREAWNELIERGMAVDFSWHNSAREYEAMYAELLKKPAAKK
ncbi:MAG: glycogen synthase GlgA, partial [Lachnospiraceae bacterium]|nr:glycogen synthase GlgA [Lachnospiraceae bacterium]